VPRMRLIGRDRELTVLREALAAALQGERQLVICRGEPGIGKTRLAEELATWAAADHVPAVWGRAFEGHGTPPYWPWRQVLRAVGEVTDVGALAGEQRLSADLGAIAPDLFQPAEQREGAASLESRFRQFDALAQLLHHVAARTPLVILLDDAHWADQPSLLLLQHLVRTLGTVRLLCMVNYRDTERAHGEIITALLREPATRQIHLTGLSAAAVAGQLAEVTGHAVNNAEAEQVRALTGGNPFFVAEMARVLGHTRQHGAPLPVVPSVREAVSARLQTLPSETVRLLRAGSVLGATFSLALAADMAGLPLACCWDHIDIAMAAGLLVAGPVQDEYQFTHALIRDAVEAGLPTAARVRLHRRAADVIQHAHAGMLEPHLFDLARHWAVAGVGDDAATGAAWIARAGREAMRRLAFEEAVRLFRLALRVGNRARDDEARCRLLLGLAAALHAGAELPGRLDACLQAAEVARRINRVDLLAEAALFLEGTLGDAQSNLAARRLCEEALSGIGATQTVLRARLTARLAQVCVYLGDVGTAWPASEEALALAEACGDRHALDAALHARQLVCDGPDGLDERERLADRLLRLGRRAPDPGCEMWARLWRVDAAFERGDLGRAARELEALRPLAGEVGGPWARWHVLRGQAVLAQAQARFADARALAEEAFHAIARTGERFAMLPRAALLQAVGHHTGHDAASLAATGLSGGTVDTAALIGMGTTPAIATAHLLLEAGHPEHALALYQALGKPVGWRPQPHGLLAAFSMGLAVAMAVDAADDVAAIRGKLEPYRGFHVASGAGAICYWAPVELWLGVGARYLGLLDDAVADLEQAVRACSISGAHGFRIEAQYELAAALAGRAGPGDRTRATALTAEAARQAAKLGMPPIAAKARALLDDLAITQPGAALTRREREVAELVASGLTNQQIATRLFLSARTAQNHVQHILTKLNLSNRSQIAAWMTAQK
jgi:DNA-binding CsgD family transcriptional regulator